MNEPFLPVRSPCEDDPEAFEALFFGGRERTVPFAPSPLVLGEKTSGEAVVGAVGTLVIHLLALLVVFLGPRLFPEHPMEGRVMMVRLVGGDCGLFPDSQEPARKGVPSAGSESESASAAGPPESAQELSTPAEAVPETVQPEPETPPSPPEPEAVTMRELPDPTPPPVEKPPENPPARETPPAKPRKAHVKAPKKPARIAAAHPSPPRPAGNAEECAPSPLPSAGEATAASGLPTGTAPSPPGNATKAHGGGSPSGAVTGQLDGEFDLPHVDKPPRILKRVEPDYPASAKSRNISGKVLVKVLVDRNGHVQQASVVEASPPGIFDQCVLDAVVKWRFQPGEIKGRPVATRVVLPIRFRLSG